VLQKLVKNLLFIAAFGFSAFQLEKPVEKQEQIGSNRWILSGGSVAHISVKVPHVRWHLIHLSGSGWAPPESFPQFSLPLASLGCQCVTQSRLSLPPASPRIRPRRLFPRRCRPPDRPGSSSPAVRYARILTSLLLPLILRGLPRPHRTAANRAARFGL
jgi:hypothetical protein